MDAKKRAFSVVAVVLIIGWFAFQQRQARLNDRNVEALARIESQREQTQSAQESDDAVDFDWFATRGKGQPVPDDLIVDPDPGGFWFVGKAQGGVGVEIPFAPGRIPTPRPSLEPVNENPGFLGAEACRECHQEMHDGFVHTAHHLTSAKAKTDSIAGSFLPSENQMKTGSPDVHFTMLERDGEFFQRTKFYDWQFEVPFHIVTGSAKMAQTFLYWHSDGLYEMNVSYLTSVDDWINSPGYIDGDAAYARPIGRRCMECHTTYADFREPPNHFTPGSFIFGVSCERCHGPGRDHVDYHKANPDDSVARHVTLTSSLTRKQQLNICSQCHSGITGLKGKPYQFRPGDDLEDHYDLPKDAAGNGVHTTNQLARLSMSGCFTQTEMTCTECHNPHQKERSNMTLFSERCLNCHQTDQCGMEEKLGDQLSDNCVDCHMPRRAGEKLRLDTADGSVFPVLRDHFIRVDSLATEEYLKTLPLLQ